MDFADTPEDEAFRAELRDWLATSLAEFEHEPVPEIEGMTRHYARRKAWQRKMAEAGWAAINWPKELGGRDATLMQNVIYSQEMAKAKTPGIFNANGIWQIGPMITRWGTQEQKDRWLNGILYAEEHWCQGFSEPEAGSDLANLRLLAIRDGDDYVLDGQKIWCTTAHYAKWGLFLVRTDPTAIERGEKHDGITALIVDMHVPGVTATPITDIVGEDSFCLVTFDNARVSASYRLGNEGEGWLVAMGTLTSERVGTAGLSITMKSELDNVVEWASANNPGALADPDLRDRLARAYTQIEMTSCSTCGRCRRC